MSFGVQRWRNSSSDGRHARTTRRRGKQNPVWYEGLDTGQWTNGQWTLSIKPASSTRRTARGHTTGVSGAAEVWLGCGHDSLLTRNIETFHSSYLSFPWNTLPDLGPIGLGKTQRDWWRYGSRLSSVATIRRLGRSWLWIWRIKVSSGVLSSAFYLSEIFVSRQFLRPSRIRDRGTSSYRRLPWQHHCSGKWKRVS